MRYFATMPTPKWRRIKPEVWEAKIRALDCSRQIRAHVACVCWWDQQQREKVPIGWLQDLRDEYRDGAKEDLEQLAAALAAAGYPADIARRRAFVDVLSGYIPKKRAASFEDTSAL